MLAIRFLQNIRRLGRALLFLAILVTIGFVAYLERVGSGKPAAGLFFAATVLWVLTIAAGILSGIVRIHAAKSDPEVGITNEKTRHIRWLGYFLWSLSLAWVYFAAKFFDVHSPRDFDEMVIGPAMIFLFAGVFLILSRTIAILVVFMRKLRRGGIS